MHKNLFLVVLIFAFGCAIGYFGIPKKSISETEIKIKRDTIWETDTLPIPKYVPKPYPVSIIDTFWRTQKIDTAAILQAYYNKNVYSDTLVNDSSLLVVIDDTISQNKIQSRIPFIVKNYPVITNTQTVLVTKDEWFVSGYFGQTSGAEISYRHRKNIFGVGGGTNGVYVKFSRKIK